MSELVIRGLTLEQYAHFSAEANMLRQKWEMSEGKLDIKKDMLAVLTKYDQDPGMYSDEDGLNYHSCGLISEWHNLIMEDPEMLNEYTTISGKVAQDAMFEEGGTHTDLKEQMFGETVGDVNMVVEGINLEKYAEVCARVQGASEDEAEGIILGIDGVNSMEQYHKAKKAFDDAMTADTSLTFTTKFGDFFAKYGVDHMAAVKQHSVDILTDIKEEKAEQEETEENALREIMKLAVAGKASEILPYIKATFPEDVDDNDALDHYADQACDLFGEAGNRDGAKAMLSVRYELTGKEENDDREEWIEDELDSLFD